MHKMIVALMLVATMLFSPAIVFAFGLGEIEINSALNQPMDAEIELVGFNSAQIDEVQVELANQQMFERVGVPRPYILTRLKFTPMLSRGKPIIRITSTDSIREPFLTFLIDVRWAKGKLLREYTVLLDPPVFGDKAKAAIQAPKVATQAPAAKKSAPKSSKIAKTPPPRVPAPSVVPKKATVPSTDPKPVALKKTKSSPRGDGTRPVRRGDTLWSIAEPYARENGVSVNQMMLAIQSANPNSFGGNNINNLKSGIVLRIPANNLSNYSAKEALAEVQRQWQVWKHGSQASSTAVNVDAGEMPASDAMPASEAKPAAEQDAAKLSILGEGDSLEGVSGDDANATLSELRKQVNLLKESSESKGQENTELKDRIQSLESMIKKQEDIISLQNEQLAQLQNSLSTASGESEILPEQSSEAVEEVTKEASEMLAEEGQSTVAEKVEQVIKPATVEPLPDFSDPIPEEFLNAQEEVDQTTPAESLVAEAEVEAKPEQPVVETPTTEVVETPLLEKIITILKEQSNALLAAGGGILALLFGGWLLRRRRENNDNRGIEASGLPAFAEEPSVDEMLDETVIATPDSVDEALDELETVDEDVREKTQDEQETDDVDDVIAEADVYISYGLYQQAEELLKEGLAKEPNNAKYQFKLAEIYHNDKKPDEFTRHVESIESSFDKSSPEWSKIAAMGVALVPAHALFAGGDSAAAVEDAIEDFEVASEDMEDFDSDDLSGDMDDNALDFTFDDNALSELDDAEQTGALENPDVNDFDNDELEESSTAMLEAGLDFDVPEDDAQATAEDEATQAFDLNAEESEVSVIAEDASSDATEVFLDFDEDQIESDLSADTTHDSETEMLDEESLAPEIDLADEAADSGTKIDNDLDEMLDGDSSETAMFDSSLFDDDSPEEHAFAEDASAGNSEDTVSLEQVQENLTAELETLSFDNDDLDPDDLEADSLPTLQTSEIGKPDLDVEDLDDNLAASETGTFEKDMLSDDVTEQFDVGDVGDIDATITDLGEFGDDYDLDTPSVIEEVGTKLDLAKAFVDMGDEDAAKETLTEVIEQGDQTQIQEAKDLLEKLD